MDIFVVAILSLLVSIVLLFRGIISFLKKTENAQRMFKYSGIAFFIAIVSLIISIDTLSFLIRLFIIFVLVSLILLVIGLIYALLKNNNSKKMFRMSLITFVAACVFFSLSDSSQVESETRINTANSKEEQDQIEKNEQEELAEAKEIEEKEKLAKAKEKEAEEKLAEAKEKEKLAKEKEEKEKLAKAKEKEEKEELAKAKEKEVADKLAAEEDKKKEVKNEEKEKNKVQLNELTEKELKHLEMMQKSVESYRGDMSEITSLMKDAKNNPSLYNEEAWNKKVEVRFLRIAMTNSVYKGMETHTIIPKRFSDLHSLIIECFNLSSEAGTNIIEGIKKDDLPLFDQGIESFNKSGEKYLEVVEKLGDYE